MSINQAKCPLLSAESEQGNASWVRNASWEISFLTGNPNSPTLATVPLLQVKSLITDQYAVEQQIQNHCISLRPLRQRRMLGTGSQWPRGEPVHNPDSAVINSDKADYKLPAFGLSAGGVRSCHAVKGSSHRRHVPTPPPPPNCGARNTAW